MANSVATLNVNDIWYIQQFMSPFDVGALRCTAKCFKKSAEPLLENFREQYCTLKTILETHEISLVVDEWLGGGKGGCWMYRDVHLRCGNYMLSLDKKPFMNGEIPAHTHKIPLVQIITRKHEHPSMTRPTRPRIVYTILLIVLDELYYIKRLVQEKDPNIENVIKILESVVNNVSEKCPSVIFHPDIQAKAAPENPSAQLRKLLETRKVRDAIYYKLSPADKVNLQLTSKIGMPGLPEQSPRVSSTLHTIFQNNDIRENIIQDFSVADQVALQSACKKDIPGVAEYQKLLRTNYTEFEKAIQGHDLLSLSLTKSDEAAALTCTIGEKYYRVSLAELPNVAEGAAEGKAEGMDKIELLVQNMWTDMADLVPCTINRTRPRIVYALILIVLDELNYIQSIFQPKTSNIQLLKHKGVIIGQLIKKFQSVVDQVNQLIPDPSILQCLMNLSSPPGGGEYAKTNELVKIPSRARRLAVFKKSGRKYVKIGNKYLTVNAAMRLQ